MRVVPGTGTRRRHMRKYAQAHWAKTTVLFPGPEGRLDLRAPDLMLFVQMAGGVDEETWSTTGVQGDYARWIVTVIGDRKLADEVAAAEQGDASAP
jgi:hypothetical protein